MHDVRPQLPQTGHHTDCGDVTALGVTVHVVEDGVDYGDEQDVAESNLCYTGGSSGGPVYKNNTGYGINSASASPSSPCDTYYAGLLGALTDLNVRLQ